MELEKRGESSRAFTLTELLVIIAMLGVLACIQVSALSLSKDQTRIAQCSANLRQITQSLQLYGGDNNDKLPLAQSGSYWAWDVTWTTGDIFNRYGTPWQTLYCPGTAARFSSQDNLNLYNYQPSSIRVMGYALALGGTSSIYPTNMNPSLIPQSMNVSGPLGITVVPAVPPSKRVLAADATISDVNQYTYSLRYSYNWTSISGGYISGGNVKPHLSPHLNGQFPAGGNQAMIDGHVEWRRFDDMQCRVSATASAPGFWW